MGVVRSGCYSIVSVFMTLCLAGCGYISGHVTSFFSVGTLASPSQVMLGKVNYTLTTTPIVAWTASTGASLYQVRVLRASDDQVVSSWQTLSSGTALTGLSLAQNTAYYAEVRAVDSAGNASSAVQTATWTTPIPGPVYSFGNNYDGQLGTGPDSTISPVLSPSQSTSVVSGSYTFSTVSTSLNGDFACGVTSTGAGYCWGDNSAGELGNGTTTNSNVPVAVSGGLTFSQISAGTDSTCGITSAGAAYCWGDNSVGELGNGTTTSSKVPVAVSGGLTFSQISAGFDYACGISSGAAYCWGYGMNGGSNTSIPVAVSGSYIFAQISAGINETCAVTTSGDGYCWGENTHGELGNGTTTNSNTPVEVSGGLTFSQISVGYVSVYEFACGLTVSGDAFCWGYNTFGDLGDGKTTDSDVPVAVSGGLTFSKISAGNFSSCGITSSGALYCWGTSPVAVDSGATFSQVSAGDEFTCAITTGGLTNCWGDYNYGALGNGGAGATTQSDVPVTASGISMNFTQTVGSSAQSCGLAQIGTAYCWGEGTLGDGITTSSTTPVAVSGGYTFLQLAVNSDFTCGLATTGEVYCWGNNSYGQLGDGTTTNSNIPVAVSGGLTFSQISTGFESACGLTLAGQAYCWGWNVEGQLGNGTTTDSSSPVAVSGGLTFSEVAAGDETACGLTSAGAVYCWGYGGYGTIGNGSTANSSTPVAVSGGLTFSQLSVGFKTACGITFGGDAYCWGANHEGELGNGATTSSDIPVAVSGGLIFSQISVSRYSYTSDPAVCGLTASNDAYCWGDNSYGEIGNGNTTNQSTPVSVSGGLTFVQITAGESTLGITN